MTDADRPEPTPAHNHGKIDQVDLQSEMQRSYLDYAMSVIVGRALPDVRDGLKPVHRRVIYGMYDGGFRPDKSFSKCARVVGEVMGQYHPHGDTAIYDALVRLVQPWSLRYPLALGQGNFGSPGNQGAAAPRYTETKMAPLALEMVRDIEEDTVDFQDNYDGQTAGARRPARRGSRTCWSTARSASRSAWRPTSRRTTCARSRPAPCGRWRTRTPRAKSCSKRSWSASPGPTSRPHAQILGTRGIQDAYRTGRGSITMRAVVNVEEIQGRTCLVITELPYQVNPDNVAVKISDLAREGKITGIADIRDETSDRTGQRLVIVLKRDAVAKVVLNNLYKHTQLQENFGANMLAIVDGVPRTLAARRVHHALDRPPDRRHRAPHAVPPARGREAHAHPARLPQGARRARRGDRAHPPLADRRRGARRPASRCSTIDDIQADAILVDAAAPPRRPRASEDHRRGRPSSKRRSTTSRRSSPTPARQRTIIRDELTAIVDRFGDDRRTQILPGYDGDMSIEDLIPEEEMVVTVTRDGYIKRTRSDNYRSQHRGGKGVKGAQLRADDVVEHFFVTTTHHWLLFFTDEGPRLPREGVRGARRPGATRRASTSRTCWRCSRARRSRRSSTSATTASRPTSCSRPAAVWSRRRRLTEYDTNRQGGVIAIKLRGQEEEDGDEVVSALLVDDGDDILLISRHGMSLRFTATDESLRPMGRSTEGVKGMSFRERRQSAVGIRRRGRRRTCSSSPTAATRSAPRSPSTAVRVAAAWASRSPS